MDRETVVRQMKVTAQKVARYGTTQACRGCEAYLTNTKGVPHNVDCRSRIREMMEKDERGREELKHEVERIKRRTDDLLRKEARKDPLISQAEDKHDQEVRDIEQREMPEDEVADLFMDDEDADQNMGEEGNPNRAEHLPRPEHQHQPVQESLSNKMSVSKEHKTASSSKRKAEIPTEEIDQRFDSQTGEVVNAAPHAGINSVVVDRHPGGLGHG